MTTRAMDVPVAVDARTTLLGFLARQRALVAWKLAGVDDARLAAVVTPSGLSARGLVRHLENTERWWFRHVFAGEDDLTFDFRDDLPDAEFRVPDDVPTAALLAAYADECARCDAAIAGRSLDDRSAHEDHSLRWVVVHMIEETSRHLGHLDLLREAADGAVGEDPL